MPRYYLYHRTGTGKDWRPFRIGKGIADQRTHYSYFVYQLCDYILGVKFGTSGAKTFEFKDNFSRLTIKNEAGENVLSGSIEELRKMLIAIKWIEYLWR